jgi:general secretion pathway protein B
MSYILEALKKSEQERNQGRAVEMLRPPVTTPAAREPIRRGWYAALAVAGLAIGTLVGSWQPWRAAAPEPQAVTATPPKPTPPSQAATSPPLLPEGAQPPPSPLNRAEALREVQSLAPPSVRAEVSGSSVPALSAQPAPAPPASPPATPPAASAPAPAGKSVQSRNTVLPPPAETEPPGQTSETKPAPQAQGAKGRDKKLEAKIAPTHELLQPPDRVVTLAELPPALRESLPALSVRGFVYSEDPGSRMVVINDRMLQEGDEVAPGLKLERIQPDGAVLSAKGYRFLAPR